MREILFKAKRLDNAEWVEGSLISTERNAGHILRSKSKAFVPKGKNTICSTECYEIDKDTICQYTGLTDKNDNKIWENDICIIEDNALDEEDGYFKCKWDAEAARFVMNGSLLVDFDNVYATDIEVVGNVFDNQELLEVE